MSKLINYCLVILSALALLMGCKPFHPESPVQKERSRELLKLLLESGKFNIPKDVRVAWIPTAPRNCIDASLPPDKCLNFVVIGAQADMAVAGTTALADQIRKLSSAPPQLQGIYVSLTPISPKADKRCTQEVTPASVNDCYVQSEATLVRIGG